MVETVSGTRIFDLNAVRAHRNRAAGALTPLRPVLDDLAARLLDRLDDTKGTFSTALDFGGRGSIAPWLAARGMLVVSADLAKPMAMQAGGLPVMVDGDAWPFAAETFDLIIAHLSLHWIDDLPGTLIQLRRALKPNGLFLASMPALGTLQELRNALLDAEHTLTGAVHPRISPFPDLRDCAGLLQRAGFALPVADIEEIEFLYANPLALLHELRAAGEANAVAGRSRQIPPRDLFPQALSQLPRQNGRYRALLRLAILTGWAS
jgi:SAM-dependent methyltransferase